MYTSHIGVNWTHASNPFYKDALQKDLKRIHHLFAKARENQVRVVPQQLSMDDIRRFLLSNRYAVLLLVNLNLLQCHLCKEKKRKEWWKKWLFKQEVEVEPPETMTIPTAIDIQRNPSPAPSSSVGSSLPSSSVPRRLSFGTFFPSSPTSSIGSHTIQPLSTKFSMSTPLIPKSPKKEPSCLGLCTQFSKSSYHFVKPVEFIGHYIVLIGYDRENDMFFYRDPGTDSKLCAICGEDLERAYCCQDTDHDLIVVRML
jgi:hypothetical protein